MITATEIQGRFGNGQGMEFAESYLVSYWRPNINKWIRYRDLNGTEVNYSVFTCNLVINVCRILMSYLKSNNVTKEIV